MSRKSKGIGAERELLHLFWGVPGWVALRAPASGAMRYPCPDLLVGSLTRKLAIECKATKAERQYIDKAQIDDLRTFGAIFGAEAWVGVRFDKMPWHFVPVHGLAKTDGENFVITRETAKNRGLLFEELVEKDYEAKTTIS